MELNRLSSVEINNVAMAITHATFYAERNLAFTLRSIGVAIGIDELPTDIQIEMALCLQFSRKLETVRVKDLFSGENAEVTKALSEEGGRRCHQKLLTMPYKEYLETDHWQVVRSRALYADKFRCRVCNSPDNLNVHHRTYEQRGREEPQDVVTLCQPCHQLFHENGRLVSPPG